MTRFNKTALLVMSIFAVIVAAFMIDIIFPGLTRMVSAVMAVICFTVLLILVSAIMNQDDQGLIQENDYERIYSLTR